MFRTAGENQIRYTVNLNPTNNRLLINGKDVDRFMDIHLPLLHGMMVQEMTDGEFREVETMNRVLSEQMNVMLSQRRGEACSSVTLSENEMQSESSIPDSSSRTRDGDNLESAVVSDEIMAERLHVRVVVLTLNSPRLRLRVTRKDGVLLINLKWICLRYVKSKAAYCESGTHWVHHHCDKLTDLDIQRLENDDWVIYNCKNCLSHNTCPKTVARDVYNSESCVAPQNRNSVLKLPSINNASDLSSPAMVILNEEVASVCGVCDNSLENDEAICDICIVK